MSRRYTTLYDLMARPQGCGVAEACSVIGVTPAGCRGMIRDLRRLVAVSTMYMEHRGRGKGRLAVHFIRHEGAAAAPN